MKYNYELQFRKINPQIIIYQWGIIIVKNGEGIVLSHNTTQLCGVTVWKWKSKKILKIEIKK